MDIAPATLVGIFDRVGIVAFAFAGVELGMRRRLDVFGLVVMGVVTATGGGVIRDLFLGRLPFLLAREDYLLIAAGSALAWIPVIGRGARPVRPLLTAADALGLGAFAAAGAVAGMERDLGLPAVLVLAVVTATGGGVVRDLMAAQVPLVLRTEVTATAAAAGAMVVWGVERSDLGLAALAGAVVTAGLRVLSVVLDIHLPVPGGVPDDGR